MLVRVRHDGATSKPVTYAPRKVVSRSGRFGRMTEITRRPRHLDSADHVYRLTRMATARVECRRMRNIIRFPRTALVLAPVAGVASTFGVLRPHPFHAVESLPAQRIIDLHCHTAGIGAGGSGCFVSPALRRSWKFKLYLRSFGTSLAEIEARGDSVVGDRISEQVAASRYVDRAVILALDGAIGPDGELDRERSEFYVPNEFVAAEVAKHDNLLFGASINPYRPDAMKRLEWAKAHRAVLVKWLPSIQHIDPADPKLVPFYRKLVELNLPLLTHTGTEHSFTCAEDTYCDPARLELAAREGVTIIAAHAATTGRYDGERSFDRLSRLMRRYPNVYADVSSLTQLNKHSHLGQVLARPEFRGRLVYGTDYPLIAMRSLVSPWYYPVRLSWTQRKRISAITNPWDRDVALKHALGLPTDCWTRGEQLLPREFESFPERSATGTSNDNVTVEASP
jgi:hypothetical protein